MQKTIECLYASLLDRQYQNELFQDLKGFRKMQDGFIACCPFHEDEHPTLVIHADRPEYFCFVCSSRGDWLSYLLQKKGMSYEKALAFLAREAGMEIPNVTRESWGRDLQRATLLELAADFFTTCLYSKAGEEALHYLYNTRGYSMEEVEGSGFGFYPGMDETRDFLESAGMTDARAIMEDFWEKDTSGLNLTIPLRDSSGRLMAVMGRDITGSGPAAYRGITDLSPVSHVPFLMYKARKKEEVLVVEGLFDAMLVDRIGCKPVIAIGNQGLSAQQLDTISFSGVKRCILCLGSSGRNRVTLEAGRLMEGQGMEVLVLPLEQAYRDLDHFIRSTDLPDFLKILKKPALFSEWSAGF